MTTNSLNATITDRQDVTDELCIIRLRPDDRPVPRFEPGQFITIGLPGPVGPAKGKSAKPGGPLRSTRRAYSIASSASVSDHLELYVVLVQTGRLTPRLWDLHPGDRLWLADKAQGHFTLEGIPPHKDLVMVSTGTGIAPYMSMLRTYRGQGRWRRFVVIHGARYAQDLGYRQELEETATQDPTVVYIPTATREPQGSSWRGLRGRVQVALEAATYGRLVGAPLDPDGCHVFLCGNPDMIRGVQQLLEPLGFVTAGRHVAGNIHFERYW